MIPIANVYYLLCYAWDVPVEGAVAASATPFRRQPDLFASILARGAEALLRRGPERGYTTVREETRRPRGKLDVATTHRRNLLARPAVACRHDVLTHDTPHNRILKATLSNLARCADVDHTLKASCHALAGRFSDVTDIQLSAAAFAPLRLNRNTHHYRLLLHVCRLLHENRLPDARPGSILFADVTRDDRPMARLFEAFVRNFYRREQRTFPRVAAERFPWRDVLASAADLALLPEMRTDVSLSSPSRKLVIDAKFYRESLSSRFEVQKVHAANLYQLLAYLQNQRPVDGQSLEGLLLYPTVNQELDLRYVLHGHRVRVATVDLDRPWQGIHDRLLELIEPPVI